MDEASFWAHKGVRRGSGRGEHRQAFTGKGRVARGAGVAAAVYMWYGVGQGSVSVSCEGPVFP